jgi:internalin A
MTTLYTFNDLQKLEQNRPQNVGKTFVFDKSTEDIEFVDLSRNENLEEIVFETPQKLRYLDASQCSISKIVIPKGFCNKLQTLYLQKNKLQRICFEGDCPSLELLDVSENELTKFDLPLEFDKLQNLYLYKNHLSNLLQLQRFFLRPYFDFVIKENKEMTAPPLEIVEQGADAVINYFKLLQKEQKEEIAPLYNFEVKIMFIGEGGTGKTSLMLKLQNEKNPLPRKEESTYGIDVKKWSFKINDQTFPHIKNLTQDELLVNCWDFGGQKIYHGTHQIFFSENSYYILVADTREEKNEFTYWFNTIMQLAGKDAMVLIVINQNSNHYFKFDKPSFEKNFQFIKEVVYIDLDNKNGEDEEKTLNIRRLQALVKRRLQEMPRIGDPLPATYIKIREDLYRHPDNFISFNEFLKICEKYKLTDTDTIKVMSKYFHEIGAITHFIDDPLLRERVFLNSDWLVKMVYKVLDDSQIKNKHGRIQYINISEIWKKENIDFTIDHLTQIMHNFGLMYHVINTNDYVIPAHLPTEKPYVDWIHLKKGNALTFKYEFEKYIPEGLMSKFIVSLNEVIEDQRYVWNHGVNVHFDNTYAEIIESIDGKSTFQINIIGVDKRGLLAIIRNKFLDILTPYKSLEYKELFPCRCKQCKIEEKPSYHELKKLQNFMTINVLNVQCEKSGVMASIQEILDFIEKPKTESAGQERWMEPLPHQQRNRKDIKIFVSYSSKDKDLCELLVEGLKGHLTHKEGINYITWSDKEIDLGANWKEEIENAMKQCNAAILLVSGSFVASDFINKVELMEFFNRKKEGGFLILPVLVRKYDFGEFEELSSLQFFKTYFHEYGFNKPIDRNKLIPFDVLGDNEKTTDQQLNDYYSKLAEHIHESVSKRY